MIERVENGNILPLRVEEADNVSTQKNKSQMNEVRKRQVIDKYRNKGSTNKIRKKEGYQGNSYQQCEG